MNHNEFQKNVFELVWGTGAKVEHYRNGLQDLPARDNHYTYEDTLYKIKKGLDLLNALKTYEAVYKMKYD